MNCPYRSIYYLFCSIYLMCFLFAGQVFASGAELVNIVVKNDRENLLIDLRIQGVFTNEMKKELLRGMPVKLVFIVTLYTVNDFWFNKKMASITTIHTIQYDVLKNEYRINRSWEKSDPKVVKKVDNAFLLMSKVDGLKITPSNILKKGECYQLRVKSELNKKKLPFTSFPWEFETDWYTINFSY